MTSSAIPAKPDIAVIGAGVVGMSCALSLLREGKHVVVVDRGAPGEGTSFGNAGVFATGHVVPIGTPGILARVPGMLMDPDSPLSIRPSYLPHLLPYLWQIVRASHPKRVEAISLALRDLLEGSIEAYMPLLGGTAMNDLIRRSGWLMVWRNDAGFVADRAANELRRRRGIRLEEIASEELRQLVPALSRDYRRALLMPDCGHTVNPLRLVQTLADQFRHEGGTILRDTVRGIELGESGPRRLATENGGIDVQGVVVAAGPDSAMLAAQLGSTVPLEGERGYHVMLPNPGIELRLPVLIADAKFGLTPMEHGIRLAGTIEFDRPDAPPRPSRHRRMIEQAKRVVPGLADAGATTWVGRRPSLPDSLPAIGASPHHRNAWFAFGHGHIGLTLGGVTGRLVADLVAGRNPGIDLAPFRIDRFAR